MFRSEKMNKIKERNIIEELEGSFIDYSMSVIISRALPDLRDGLKPVHRRILYGMYALGITPEKPFKKSARIVGDVVGKYHPHGDVAVYESMVRMIQDFAFRYPLVSGHGNFGSIDGYGAAAMRYTEARMAKISNELLRDLNKDTVDFVANYDGQEKEPVVLPSRFPNILVNGTMGIAVGMATNIPPHNLGEVIDGCVALIDDEEISNQELMNYIKGPDFPTGATILGNNGIRQAHETGRGSILIRAQTKIVNEKGKEKIIITEIPFQVNKKSLITKIADLVKEKKIEGISGLIDETNLKGMKIVIELKKEANAEVVLNNLYKNTNLQTSYSINLLSLVDGRPQTLSLREIISKYLEYQKEVVIRRSRFDLNKAEKRVHILEGLNKALSNIDEVVKIIKEAASEEEANKKLITRFHFSVEQAEAILEMKLRRLTGLEREKIENELKELAKLIKHLKELLVSDEKIKALIKEELMEIKEKYNDARRTIIEEDYEDDITDESLIPITENIVMLTNKGYIKRCEEENYRVQKRGGVGLKGISVNEEDVVEQILYCKSHDHVLFFSNRGKVYRLKGYEIPTFGRQAKGLPVVNLLPLDEGERINTIQKNAADDPSLFFIFCTRKGLVKRVKIEDFDSIRKMGKIAIRLNEDDELLAVRKSSGSEEVFIASSEGKMVRFLENQIRVMGRTAAGVKGINLDQGICVGCEITADESQKVLVVTEKGYGKLTPIKEYRTTKRGAKGVKTLKVNLKKGPLVAFKIIDGSEEIMLISNTGTIIRTSAEQIAVSGRATQGVRIINLKEKQQVTSIAVVDKEIACIEEEVSRETK